MKDQLTYTPLRLAGVWGRLASEGTRDTASRTRRERARAARAVPATDDHRPAGAHTTAAATRPSSGPPGRASPRLGAQAPGAGGAVCGAPGSPRVMAGRCVASAPAPRAVCGARGAIEIGGGRPRERARGPRSGVPRVRGPAGQRMATSALASSRGALTRVDLARKEGAGEGLAPRERSERLSSRRHPERRPRLAR